MTMVGAWLKAVALKAARALRTRCARRRQRSKCQILFWRDLRSAQADRSSGYIFVETTMNSKTGRIVLVLLVCLAFAPLLYADEFDDLARDFWTWRAAEMPVST